MERLEAALEKARTDRQAVQATVVPVDAVETQTAPKADPWDNINQAKISARTARSHRITAMTQNKQSGSYDLLRSRALRIMNENGWSSMAITSPNKTCGKTTVCTNLAFSLARQPDLRILVLDMDLRRPALHKILGQRPSKSLHEALSGTQPIESALVKVSPNLVFGLNTSPAVNPSELLQSRKTREILEAAMETYQPDIIIYDMPPMLVSDDNVAFLPSVDCGLLIGAADSTTVTQIDVCEKELADLTNVLGVVLNKCRFAENNAGYDYDYY